MSDSDSDSDMEEQPRSKKRNTIQNDDSDENDDNSDSEEEEEEDHQPVKKKSKSSSSNNKSSSNAKFIDDAAVLSGSEDDDDEDDDDDEKNNEYERDGFVVDEADEDEDDDDNFGRRRRKKRRKKKLSSGSGGGGGDGDGLSDSDEEDAVRRKKTRLKKLKNTSQLDEDDLALIEESQGIRRSGNSGDARDADRSRRGGGGGEDDEDMDGESEEAKRRRKEAAIKARSEAELKNQLFDGDAEDNRGGRKPNKNKRSQPMHVENFDEENMDDFIEYSDDERGGDGDDGGGLGGGGQRSGVSEAQLDEANDIFGTDFMTFAKDNQDDEDDFDDMDDEDGMGRKEKYREKGVDIDLVLDSEEEISSDEEYDTDDDIFGTGDENDDGLGAEALRLQKEKRKLSKRERRKAAMEKKAERQKARLRKAFEPVQLIENFCTDRDDEIRKLDAPERFFDWKTPYHGPDIGSGTANATTENVAITIEEEEEAMWIANRIPPVASEFHSNVVPVLIKQEAAENNITDEMELIQRKQQAILESIVRALRYMHIEKLEPEFIRKYRADYVTSPAVRENLYTIMDEDGEWDQMRMSREKARKLMNQIVKVEQEEDVVGDQEEKIQELRGKLHDAREQLDESVKEEERVKTAIGDLAEKDNEDDELFGDDDDDDEDEEKKAQKMKDKEKLRQLKTASQLVKAHSEIVANLTSNLKTAEDDAANALSSSGKVNIAEIKKKLCKSKLWNAEDYNTYLESITEQRHAADLYSYLSLIKEGNDAARRADANAPDTTADKKKQRSKRADRDYYRTCVSQGLRSICYKIVLSPHRAGIKLEESLTKPDGFTSWDRVLRGEDSNNNNGNDMDENSGPAAWNAPLVEDGNPNEFATNLIDSGELVLLSNMNNAGVQDRDHPEIRDPLRGCRYVAAMELAFEPRIRKHLRGIYRAMAVVTSRPTPKGIENIDPFHEYYGLHLLKNKKVKDHFPIDENEAAAQKFGFSVEEQKELDEKLKRVERDSCIQYMNMLKAEKTGHLKVSIHLPITQESLDKPWYENSDAYFKSYENQNLIPLMQELEKIYYPMNADTEEWNEERKKILHLALTKFLLPKFEAETRRDLRDAAVKMGVDAAKKNLYNMAMEGPYRPSHLLGENRFLVPTGDLPIVGVCCSSDGRDATYLAAVTEEGELSDNLAVPAGTQIDSHKMREKVITFLIQAKPSAIVVGTHGGLPNRLVARKLGDLATQATERWNNRFIQGQDEDDDEYQARQEKYADGDDDDDDKWLCNVESVDDNVAQLFGRSVRGKKEFPDASVNLKCAIACARHAKDPLAELTYTWSSASDAGVFGTEMLYLNIHPLQQVLPKSLLLREYERVLCHAVAEVGVDINLSCRFDHHHGLLTFVPGLGARKAATLKESFDSVIGGMISSRRDLLAKRLVGSVVFNNCVAFLRIRESDLYTDQVYHPLDDTRVHPDVYILNNWATKIALNALDRDSSEMDNNEEEGIAITAIRDVMEDSRNEVDRLFTATRDEYERAHQTTFNVSTWDPRINVQSDLWKDKVEDLDLDEFARMLAKKGDGKWQSHLTMIKEEFRLPFEDPRKPMEPLDKEKLFTLMTGESHYTLCPGKEVTGKVVRNGDFGSYLKLEGDVPGFIPLRNLADGHVESAEDIVQVGKVVTAIVTEVKVDHMSVDLSLKMEDIKKPPSAWERPEGLLPLDAFFDRLAAATIEADLAKKREERLAALMPKVKEDGTNGGVGLTGRVTRRACAHPAFRNAPHKELDQELKEGGEAMVGEALIRPSSKEADNLVLHWLVQTGVIKVIIITEEDKDNDASIGNSLKIKGETYGDIDELLARYISPMNERVEEVVHHRKFLNLKKEDVEQKLKDLKAANPTGVFYFLSWNERYPGSVSLRFVINSVKSHLISISPDGFVWCGKTYSSMDQVLNGFKKNPSGRSSSGPSNSRTSRWGERRNPPPPPPAASHSAPPPPPATNGNWNRNPPPPAPANSGWGGAPAAGVTANSGWNGAPRPPPPSLPPPPTSYQSVPPAGSQGWNQQQSGSRPMPPSLPPPPSHNYPMPPPGQPHHN